MKAKKKPTQVDYIRSARKRITAFDPTTKVIPDKKKQYTRKWKSND